MIESDSVQHFLTEPLPAALRFASHAFSPPIKE